MTREKKIEELLEQLFVSNNTMISAFDRMWTGHVEHRQTGWAFVPCDMDEESMLQNVREHEEDLAILALSQSRLAEVWVEMIIGNDGLVYLSLDQKDLEAEAERLSRVKVWWDGTRNPVGWQIKYPQELDAKPCSDLETVLRKNLWVTVRAEGLEWRSEDHSNVEELIDELSGREAGYKEALQ